MPLVRFIDKLRDGDHSLEADLLTAAEAKADSWAPRENSCYSLELEHIYVILICRNANVLT